MAEMNQMPETRGVDATSPPFATLFAPRPDLSRVNVALDIANTDESDGERIARYGADAVRALARGQGAPFQGRDHLPPQSPDLIGTDVADDERACDEALRSTPQPWGEALAYLLRADREAHA